MEILSQEFRILEILSLEFRNFGDLITAVILARAEINNRKQQHQQTPIGAWEEPNSQMHPWVYLGIALFPYSSGLWTSLSRFGHSAAATNNNLKKREHQEMSKAPTQINKR